MCVYVVLHGMDTTETFTMHSTHTATGVKSQAQLLQKQKQYTLISVVIRPFQESFSLRLLDAKYTVTAVEALCLLTSYCEKS